MKRLWNWLWHKMPNPLKSIRYTMLSIVMLSCGVSILLLATGSYWAYRQGLLDVMGTNRADVLSQVGNQVRDFKQNAYTLSDLYYTDPTFRSYATSLNPDTHEAFTAYMDQLTVKYKVSFNRVNLDYEVIYRPVEGAGYASFDEPEGYDYINPSIRIWNRNLIATPGDIVDVGSYYDSFTDESYLLTARSVLDGTGAVVGHLMIAVNETQVYQTYADVVPEQGNIYVCDNNSNMISSSIRHVVGTQYINVGNLSQTFGDQEYIIIDKPDGQYLLTSHVDLAYNFQVYEEIPVEYIIAPIVSTRNIVVALAGVVALIGMCLASFLSNRTTAPIRRLRDHVLQVKQGDMDTVFCMDSYTELNTLNDSITQMLEKIKALMESEKQKEAQKRAMHYHLLQAQINPHFMYNTLFSIKCVVDMNERQTASQMLSAFIQLLRNSLSNPESLRTVGEEVDALRQYGDLQRFRYGETFNLVLECEEQVNTWQIPPLLIQPLVENAIVHGVATCGHTGVIAVTLRGTQQVLTITVEDNGLGMNAQTLSQLLAEEPTLSTTHIGINNIHHRIRLHYGAPYGVQIESHVDEGTKVTVTLPRLTEETT